MTFGRLLLLYTLILCVDARRRKPRAAKKEEKPQDYYALLGTSRDEVRRNPKTLKKNYLKQAKKWHPDGFTNADEETKRSAEEKMAQINAAYETLKDDEKRNLYDQHGHDYDKATGGDGGGGGHDHFADMFRHFTGGGGQGGGFKFSFGGGGNPFGGGDPFGGGSPFGGGGGGRGGGQPEKRIFTKTDVPEWKESEYEKNIANPSKGQFTAILYYRHSQTSKELKQEYVDAQKTFKETVELVAINCGKNSDICEKEKIQLDAESPTLVLYYVKEDGKMARKRMSSGTLNAKSMGNWIRDGLPDFTKPLRTEKDLHSLASNEDKALVILFTDKKHVPVIIKVLAAKFQRSVIVAVVKELKKESLASNPVTSRLKVEKTPTLLCLNDRESLEADVHIGDMTMQYLSLFFARSGSSNEKRKNEPKPRKLTAELHKSGGHCAHNVSNFCLVKLGTPSKAETVLLNDLAKKLKSNHVLVYWIDASEFPALAETFANSKLVLWRPKRRKWKAFEGNFSVTAIQEFVDNAVNGGAPLPHSHTEL